MVKAFWPMESVYLPALVRERPRRASSILFGAEQVRVAERHLLIEDADGAVGLAVERQRNGGIVDARFLAVADAQEPGSVGVLLVVEAKVALVGVVGEGDFLGVVVGSQAG